ncbi:MAG: TOBE domain-containing protein [Pseudonocardiaceae bacterium]
MPVFRIGEAARLLGVSDDTLRRWADIGRVASTTTESGRRGVDGAELARFVTALAADAEEVVPQLPASACNQLAGLVTRVIRDQVMAQVEIQAGPHRIVSLMSAEAVDELGLEPGVLAVATVRSTSVVVTMPQPPLNGPTRISQAKRSKNA